MHATSRVFNTFTFIFTQLLWSTTIMQAWTLPLNQTIAIIAFDSNLKSLSDSHSTYKIKIWKNSYLSALNLNKTAMFQW